MRQASKPNIGIGEQIPVLECFDRLSTGLVSGHDDSIILDWPSGQAGGLDPAQQSTPFGDWA